MRGLECHSVVGWHRTDSNWNLYSLQLGSVALSRIFWILLILACKTVTAQVTASFNVYTTCTPSEPPMLQGYGQRCEVLPRQLTNGEWNTWVSWPHRRQGGPIFVLECVGRADLWDWPWIRIDLLIIMSTCISEDCDAILFKSGLHIASILCRVCNFCGKFSV